MSKAQQIPEHGSSVERSAIPAACKWHVQDIYADEAAWRAACDEYKAKLPQLKAMQGTLVTGSTVLAALRLQDVLAQLLDKIYAYARLQQDADNTDQHLQALSGEAEGLAASFSNANSFIEPEMLGLGREALEAMLQEEAGLGEYRFYIQNLLRQSAHILSAEKEAVFAQSHLATGTAAAAFRALVSADMQFPEIVDGNGNKASVSEGNYILNMTSPDRELRKNAQDAMALLLKSELPFDRLPAIASADGAHFMLSYMRDMLLCSLGRSVECNPDRAEEIAALAPRFTTGRINCIIEVLASALERLSTNAPAGGTFTRLFTEITEEL